MKFLITFSLLLAAVAVVRCQHHSHHGHAHDDHDSHEHDDHDDDSHEHDDHDSHDHDDHDHDDHDDHDHHGRAPEGTILPADDPCHGNCATWCGTHEHAEDNFHAFHNVSTSACHCPDECYCEFEFDEEDGQMHHHAHHVTLSISHYSGSAHTDFCQSE